MTEHECVIRELVAGTSTVPADELPPLLTDPDTGESLHPQRASSTESVETAITTAWAVHTEGAWTGLPRSERVAALRSFKAELESRAEIFGRADSLDSGVPLEATTERARGIAVLVEMGAAQLDEGFEHVEQSSSAGAVDQWRLPWGPAAAIIPWNAPTHMAILRVTDALVAGAPVILKPSEWSPHFTGAFAAAVQAALPPGVVQIVHGGRSVGETLVEDERIAAVTYTGGVPGGTAVAEACARQLKPVDLELSGNNPVVVLPGTDPDHVAEQVVTALLTLNAQYCIGPRRLIVQEDEAEALTTALGAALERVSIGVTTDPATQLGPMSHEPHQRRIEGQLAELAERGCEVRRHGQLPAAPGHFVAPALVLADTGTEIRDEVFGPVLVVRTCRDVDEAVTIANDHAYGLSGYVFGDDRDAARAVGRRLRAGFVMLNSAYGAPDVMPVAGLWGVSGLGQFGVGQGAKFFSGSRFVG